MTSMYNEAGKNLPCTVLEVGPCVVTQVKTEDKDGYAAVQVGFGDRKASRTTQAMAGHFKKAGVQARQHLAEFSGFGQDYNPGDEVKLEDVFAEGEFVSVVGTSKGRGFQGVVRRHGFAGVGQATHGQHNRMRAPGSIGAASTPARSFPAGCRSKNETGTGTEIAASEQHFVHESQRSRETLQVVGREQFRTVRKRGTEKSGRDAATK